MRRRESNIRRALLPVVLLPTIAALAACGGDSDSPGGREEAPTSLTYSYPIDQQMEVPTPAPVVLRFSDSVEELGLEGSIVLRSGDGEVTTEAGYADKGHSLILTPTEKLAYHSDYVIDFADDFPIDVEDITFSTRAAEEGLRADVISDEDMELVRILPSDGEYDPMMDFSTLRMQFTQPIDRETVSYGTGADDTVALIDENEDPVPAWVVVDGPYLTIDPKEDLIAGHEYQIRFKAGVERGDVASIYGETFLFQQGPRFAVEPSSSLAEGVEPDERPLPLVQYITTPEDQVDDEVAGGNDDQENKGDSPLTGKPVNEIPVNAVLLGDEDTTHMATTQQEGTVLGDLAFLPDWPRVSPLRIRRGTLLTGDDIDVKIGGEVDAGFDSGQVRVHFLSDATGYLIPNIYDPDGPRMLRLFMDVALSTEDPTANGGVTQDITHLELVGTVTTDTDEGVIDINAVGVVEPLILGQERGYGTLSFQLQTDRDQTVELVEEARQESRDLTPPELQSWTLGDDGSTGDNKADFYKPGDPIVLNFDEPIERESVEGKVTLYGLDGNPMPINYHVDGAALIIEPVIVDDDYQGGDAGYAGSSTKRPQSVMPSAISEDQSGNYTVQVDGGITDLAGNSTGMPLDQQIDLPIKVEDMQVLTPGSLSHWNEFQKHSPIVLSAYPGFPCVLSEDGRDLDANLAGRCMASYPGSDGTTRAHITRPKDDVLPVNALPANRPVVVQFNKEMDPESFVLGTTFKMEKYSDSGDPTPVPGNLSITGRTLMFTPNQPWEDGQLYQYTIVSSGFEYGIRSGAEYILASDDFECGVSAVCDLSDQLPLQTRALGLVKVTTVSNSDGTTEEINLTGPDFDAGGPTMTQFFRGAEANENVLQVLSTAPVSDVNHSFYHEADSSPDARYQATLGTANIGRYEYGAQEYGPSNEPDNRFPTLDPDGLMPGKNSAKVISRGITRPLNSFPYVNGMNIGCAYDSVAETTSGCPEDIFTYLTSAIVAEVTNEVEVDGNGDARIKVLMWPSQVAGTSLKIMGMLNAVPPGAPPVILEQAAETGPQFLRMRYAEDEQGNRTSPITAWIKNEDGTPVLEASVDLYLNAPYAGQWGIGGAQNFISTASLPLKMTLKGNVDFLDDGRMVVEQYNTENVDAVIELGSCTPGDGCLTVGYGDLFIPEKGSRLNFISQSIK